MAARSSSRREHSERFKTSAELLDFEIPYSVAELDAIKQLVVAKNNFAELLCAARRLARQRDDGGRGAELDDPRRHRGLGLAEHVRHRDRR